MRADDVLDALYGPVFYRALITGTEIPRSFTDQLVETVLAAGG